MYILDENSIDIKTEADSNDISDDKPSTGMFGFSDATCIVYSLHFVYHMYAC